MRSLSAFFLCCALCVSLAEDSLESLAPLLVEKHSVSADVLGNLLFEEDAVSIVMCAAMCKATPNCRSVTLTARSSQSSFSCRGHANPTTTTTTNFTTTNSSNTASPITEAWFLVVSSWLEKQCLNDSECGEPMKECVAGSCLCRPGYYYSLTRDSCVHTCDQQQLRTQWLAYPGKRISGRNIDAEWSLTLRDCLELCTHTPNARTCDYLNYSTAGCAVQSLTRLDIAPGEWVDDPRATHYQKTCV